MPIQDFSTVYTAAANGDEKTLRELVSSGACLTFGKYVLTKLAEAGNHTAVNLLVDKFGGSVDDAVEGYAFEGNSVIVNELIVEKDASRDASNERSSISKDEMRPRTILSYIDITLFFIIFFFKLLHPFSNFI